MLPVSSPSSIRHGKYLYELWPAKNHAFICCNTSCFFARDYVVYFIHLSLIFGNVIVFLRFVAYPYHIATFIIGILLCCITLFYLFRTTFTEAGILPRSNIFIRSSPYHDSSSSSTGPLAQPPTQLQHGIQIPLKWCHTCQIYRPLRASHCRDCDNCVEQFDHHCPWVCNCVGRRNYRYFVSYLVCVTVLAVYLFSISLLVLITDSMNANFESAVHSNPVALIEIIITAIIGSCVSSLAAYHMFLITRNLTTHEYLKSYDNPSVNNNDSDISCYDLWCAPIPPSKIDLKQWIEIPQNVSSVQQPQQQQQYIPSSPLPSSYNVQMSTLHTTSPVHPVPHRASTDFSSDISPHTTNNNDRTTTTSNTNPYSSTFAHREFAALSKEIAEHEQYTDYKPSKYQQQNTVTVHTQRM